MCQALAEGGCGERGRETETMTAPKLAQWPFKHDSTPLRSFMGQGGQLVLETGKDMTVRTGFHTWPGAWSTGSGHSGHVELHRGAGPVPPKVSPGGGGEPRSAFELGTGMTGFAMRVTRFQRA